MKVLITGATGLIGSALDRACVSDGIEVVRLTHSRSRGEGFYHWDPTRGQFDSNALKDVDVVVHLAGESIAGGRWTVEKKRRIRESRVLSTRLLATAAAATEPAPKLFMTASAVGYYGDRGGEWLSEDSSPGSGFLPDVCREWEAATAPAIGAGITVINFRLGVVISSEGGAVSSMLTPFKLGVGGKIGSGEQYMSWIALDDVVGALKHLMRIPSISGPVNTCSPNPVTNAEFTKALGRTLGRPTVLPLPAFAARLVLGEMADGLLLASARMKPEKLLDSGYQVLFTDIQTTLDHYLKK